MPVYHPEFVHFPIALLALSVIFDVIAFVFRSGNLRSTGWWTLFGAAVGGVVTVATGLWDMYSIPIHEGAERYVDLHMWVGFAILAAAGALAIWRGYVYAKRLPVSGPYVLAGLLVLALITFQNWLGGELVYGYGVGVAPTGQSREKPQEAQAHLEVLDKYIAPVEIVHDSRREDNDRGTNVKHEEPNERSDKMQDHSFER
ncbi:MAG TPA: DUF2231 domain-containing protein [Planctomycetota bacterium]|jgi:uncharacterized membrane protein